MRGRPSSPRAPVVVALATMAGAIAAVLASVGPSAQALTTAAGPCQGDSGVTVVVDFGSLGPGIQTRCAPEPVSSGFDALSRAGFSYEGTTRFPGLLCRIDGRPSPEQDRCYNAPPPTHYWAYWTAPSPGGAWAYSDTGAGNRDPEPGSVEGWAFSDGCTRKPGTPAACPATSTTSTTATSTPTIGSPSAPSGAGSGASTPRPSGAPGSTTSTPAAHVAATPGEPADGEPTTTTDDSSVHAPTDEHALGLTSSDQTPTKDDPGSPVGLIAATVVGLVLVGGASVRRRRSAVDPEAGAE